MTTIVTLDLAGFRPVVGAADQEAAVRAIEEGGVLVLPKVRFGLSTGVYHGLNCRVRVFLS